MRSLPAWCFFRVLDLSAPLEIQAEDVWVCSGKEADVYVDTAAISVKNGMKFNVIVKSDSGFDNDLKSTEGSAAGTNADNSFLAKDVFAVCV